MTTKSPSDKTARAAALPRILDRALSPLLLIVGAAVLVTGVSMWSTAAAVVLAGMLLLVAGVLTVERGPAK